MAKKKKPEQEIRRGLEELRQSGIALEEASADLVPRLLHHLGRRHETDLAVAFSLGKVADPRAVEALLDIEKGTTDKEIRKESRRSLFKLKQRGLVVPEEQEQDRSQKASTPLLGGEAEIEAYMSAVDGAGGRLLWIAKPQTGRGLQLIQGMISDSEGLMRVGGTHVPRKELRKMAADIKQQHGVTMVGIPWEYADRVLYEAYEKAKTRGQSGLENFHELRSIIASGKPKERPHPIYEKLDRNHVREGAWRETSRRLLDEPELRYWILTDDWLQRFLPQLKEAQASRLVLNPVQKEERLSAIVREAVKELFAAPNGPSFQRRMEDTALYFFETGRPSQAALALAVALQIEDGDPGPLDISFLTGLVQKSVAFFLAQERVKKEDEPSLIIKP